MDTENLPAFVPRIGALCEITGHPDFSWGYPVRIVSMDGETACVAEESERYKHLGGAICAMFWLPLANLSPASEPELDD